MDLPDPNQLRITDPADLLALVPYLLGYAPDPDNSLVLLAQRAVVVELTLPRLDEGLQPLRDSLTRLAATALARPGVDVILIGYGSPDRVKRAVAATRSVLRSAGLPVRGALRVTNGRYFTLDRDCPAEGIAFDPSSSIAAVAAVATGAVAFLTRQALAATIAPVTGAARTSMHAATATACQTAGAMVDAALHDTATGNSDAGRGGTKNATWDSPAGRAVIAAAVRCLAQARLQYRRGQRLDDQQAALMTVLLDIPGVARTAARHTSGQPWQITMWSDLVRRAEPAFTATPACLLSLTALHAGQGVLAGLAARRALGTEPNNPLAQLLALAVTWGIDPDRLNAALAN